MEQEWEKLKVAELFDDSSSMASEFIFPGLVLAQVGEVTVLPSLRQSNSCFGCMGTYGWVRGSLWEIGMAGCVAGRGPGFWEGTLPLCVGGC